jgi:uncharacterized membrane protein
LTPRHLRSRLTRPFQGYVQVAIAAALWGTIGVAARDIFASGLTPLDAATWRATGACALLLLYCLLTDRRALAITWRDLPLFAAYGAISVAGFMTVYFVAIRLSTVATSAVLLYTAPAWVVLLARIFFGEPITHLKALAVALAFVGCVLVIGGIGPGTMRLSPAALLAGLGAGLTYALYSIFWEGRAAPPLAVDDGGFHAGLWRDRAARRVAWAAAAAAREPAADRVHHGVHHGGRVPDLHRRAALDRGGTSERGRDARARGGRAWRGLSAP